MFNIMKKGGLLVTKSLLHCNNTVTYHAIPCLCDYAYITATPNLFLPVTLTLVFFSINMLLFLFIQYFTQLITLKVTLQQGICKGWSKTDTQKTFLEVLAIGCVKQTNHSPA